VTNQLSTEICDDDLDEVIKQIARDSPNNGSVMVWGQLKSYKIYVPRRRVRESLLRVSPRAVHNRASRTVQRRVYKVPCSNSLWHIDGLHCLIRWRIVIHSCIDGYSRKIAYLSASNNNKAATVTQLFLRATSELGWPSRVRSDKGGENVGVCRAMLVVKGTGRASHIAGSSVHNQRIERLWRDTFRCVCHTFYALFYELEDTGLLSPTNEIQLYCLQYVFLPRINIQLNQFVNGWNDHHLRSENGYTPNQMWLQGMLDDRFDTEVDPDFGVFTDQPNPFDVGNVDVPASTMLLSQQQIQELKERYNPVSHSNINGLDLYVDVCTLVNSWFP